MSASGSTMSRRCGKSLTPAARSNQGHPSDQGLLTINQKCVSYVPDQVSTISPGKTSSRAMTAVRFINAVEISGASVGRQDEKRIALAGCNPCAVPPGRRPAGRLRAGCRAQPPDRALRRGPEHPRRGADHRAGRRRSGRRCRPRRAARRAPDAEQRRRQLHQYVLALEELRLSLPHPHHHEGRVRGVQSVAGADGLDHPSEPEALRIPDLSGGGAERCRRYGRRRLRHGVQWRSPGRYPVVATADRPQTMEQVMLDRREFVRELLLDRKDLLVVSGLGSPTYDVAACGDHPLNFYLWGAMGGAAMIGLGLALAQPALRVLVLTGDGEMLMGMGSLATIAAAGAANLAIAVLDNARYGETGSQLSHTGLTTDLAAVAAACGWPATATAREMDEVET